MSGLGGGLPGPSEANPIDVRYYVSLVWRGRYLVASVAAVVLLLGTLTAYLQTPEYQASTVLEIEPPTPAAMTVGQAMDVGGNYWQNTDYYNTQWQVLKSRTLGEQVALRLKLHDQAAFKDKDAGTLVMAHVTIKPFPESRLVTIHVSHTDPQEAARWANTLADVYIERTLSSRVESARRAYGWLQERLTATQEAMKSAQGKLFDRYKDQDMLFTPDNSGGISSVGSSLARLNEDFVTAGARRIELEAALKQAAQMESRRESLDTLPQVVSDPVILSLNNQLATYSLELSRLKEKFRDAHPEVQNVQSQLAQVLEAKNARARTIVQGMRADLSQVQKREAELRLAIDQQKAQASSQSRKTGEMEALRKEAESAKNLYEVLLQKLNETDIAASVRSNNVTVVERAMPPAKPVKPQKRTWAIASLLLGLMLGVGLVLGRDLLENSIKNPEDVESYLRVQLLAAVPQYDETNVQLVTEAYQNLRTAMIFARREEAGQVVLVAGTAPQEGKTTTLVNIAKLLAASGEKTLAIDFDLRRAQLHSRLGLPREPGITDHFVHHLSLDDVIQPTHVPNLYAATAGTLPPNPPAILARKQMAQLLDELRGRFEWVLLDSPPLASVTDALLLARYVDMAVFVVEYNGVDKKLIRRSINALQRATPNLLGAVLNAVDVRQKDYYYKYYDSYTSDPPPDGSESDNVPGDQTASAEARSRAGNGSGAAKA